MRSDVYTADILDNRFVLIGTERGLFFNDLSELRVEPIPLIRNVIFRQIEIIGDYGVMLALSGKHSHLRQYRLSSIRKLIMYVLGGNAAQLAKTNMDDSFNVSVTEQTVEDVEYKLLNEPVVEDETSLVAKWSSDYIKLVSTKDAKSFLVQRSETSIFMGALFRQDVILYEWAKEPYLKFLKLKAFWLPESPKFMNLLHDGLIIREVYMAYANEANIIQVSDSKVRDVDVHREFSKSASKLGTSSSSGTGGNGGVMGGFGLSLMSSIAGSQPRWQSFMQIPFSDAKRSELKSLGNTFTVNKKLAAVQGASKTANNSTAARVDRYFLATFHRTTRVVDVASQPLMGSGVGGWKDGVTWLDPPSELVLRPVDHVIAVGPRSVEIVDWKSARPVQSFQVDNGASIKCVSSREGSFLVLVERKRRGVVLFHLKEELKERKALPPPGIPSPTKSELDEQSSHQSMETGSSAETQLNSGDEQLASQVAAQLSVADNYSRPSIEQRQPSPDQRVVAVAPRPSHPLPPPPPSHEVERQPFGDSSHHEEGRRPSATSSTGGGERVLPPSSYMQPPPPPPHNSSSSKTSPLHGATPPAGLPLSNHPSPLAGSSSPGSNRKQATSSASGLAPPPRMLPAGMVPMTQQYSIIPGQPAPPPPPPPGSHPGFHQSHQGTLPAPPPPTGPHPGFHHPHQGYASHPAGSPPTPQMFYQQQHSPSLPRHQQIGIFPPGPPPPQQGSGSPSGKRRGSNGSMSGKPSSRPSTPPLSVMPGLPTGPPPPPSGMIGPPHPSSGMPGPPPPPPPPSGMGQPPQTMSLQQQQQQQQYYAQYQMYYQQQYQAYYAAMAAQSQAQAGARPPSVGNTPPGAAGMYDPRAYQAFYAGYGSAPAHTPPPPPPQPGSRPPGSQ